MSNIGKIIRSENHILYWAQVENKIEDDNAPTPVDCAFGTFVKIIPSQAPNIQLIGLLIDTILIDHDALRAGPRLAPDVETTNFLYPDFTDERIKLVKVLLIGFIDENGNPHHYFPDLSPHLNDSVIKMEHNEIEKFHIINGNHEIGYYSAAIGVPSSLVKPLFLRILPRLMEFFPESRKPILKLLKDNLEFKMKLEGGFL